MSAEIFESLRNRGCDQWVEIESYRLAIDAHVKRLRKWNTGLGLATLVSGILVGTSGTDLLNLLQAGITSVTTPLFGFVTALFAGSSQFMRFGERIEKATGKGKELKAQRDQIVGHIYRLQREADLAADTQQLFFDQRADELRNLTEGLSLDHRQYRAMAEIERNRNAFANLAYAGQVPADDDEAEQSAEAAEDIAAFGRGA